PSMRSNRLAQQSRPQTGLSRAASARSLLRWDQPKAANLSQQQLSSPCAHHRPALSVSLASRTFLSLDQTASADQGLLRYFPKCGQDSSLDCYLRLRLSRHRQKTTELGAQPSFDSTDFERFAFRKNPDFTSSFSTAVR